MGHFGSHFVFACILNCSTLTKFQFFVSFCHLQCLRKQNPSKKKLNTSKRGIAQWLPDYIYFINISHRINITCYICIIAFGTCAFIGPTTTKGGQDGQPCNGNYFELGKFYFWTLLLYFSWSFSQVGRTWSFIFIWSIFHNLHHSFILFK